MRRLARGAALAGLVLALGVGVTGCCSCGRSRKPREETHEHSLRAAPAAGRAEAGISRRV